MGNDQSKREDAPHAPQPVQTRERALPELTTRPKELVSLPLPVDPHWYETPDTPTSDLSFSEFDDGQGGGSLRSYKPLGDDPFSDDELSCAVQQLVSLYVHGPCTVQLLVGYLDGPSIERLRTVAKCVGFETCIVDVPYVRLVRGSQQESPDVRQSRAQTALEVHEVQLGEIGILELDGALEESLSMHLTENVKSRLNGEWNGATLVEYEIRGFLLPPETIEKIFSSVADACHVTMQVCDNMIALTPEVKPERSIQKGELVWRRLQHWSTNVRKEKKFNIWAKGLADDVKTRILQIALEIGFETAMVQPNGNIHLEIKPPEGQHRRKLKHATDELRMELEPIDDAVCQNVEQHLTEWLSEFQQSGKQKDVLNCRFVLPAEWLRQTSEKLASHYGLCVNMETGIDLLFYRPEVDPKTIQDTGAKEARDKKSKAKNRTKKKIADPPVKSEAMSNGQHVIAEQERPLSLFEARSNDPIRAANPTNRRTSSRNKYDYGWDPSWPTAHPERAAASQHTY